ncbi:MAG: efflux RND transporter periplasmic adaptor subunit [Chromatiales bacterium]|nr:efflux RND transporter periplasmic adaptor subunit [Chromatiales bacterium]
MKRLLIVLALFVAIFGPIAAWKAFSFHMMNKMLSQPQPPAVIAATEVREETWQPALEAVGSLVAENGITVTTEMAGKVAEIRSPSGSLVAKGDVLLTLDDSVERAALAALRADARLARVKFDRAADLLPKRAISQAEYDERQAAWESAEALAEAEAARIKRMTIRAPFSGQLGIVEVSLGEYLQPGDPIVSLQALDPIFVDYTLPERYFPRLAVGQTVNLSVDALPDETFTGQVSALESGIDAGTRTIKVRATLANPEGRLRPGMFAEVQTVEGREERVLTVPRTAVSFNTYGDFIFVIEAGEGEGALVARRRQVTTGESREGHVVITRGVEAGERVVRAGLVKLRDGQAVTIDNSVELDDAGITQE